jgi:hypothetical protein
VQAPQRQVYRPYYEKGKRGQTIAQRTSSRPLVVLPILLGTREAKVTLSEGTDQVSSECVPGLNRRCQNTLTLVLVQLLSQPLAARPAPAACT